MSTPRSPLAWLFLGAGIFCIGISGASSKSEPYFSFCILILGTVCLSEMIRNFKK